MNNKIEKLEFIKKNNYLILGVVEWGYDSYQAIELEKAIRSDFHCALKTSRRKLFSSFIKLWAETTKPGFFIIGGRQMTIGSKAKDMPIILNDEEVVSRKLRADRVMEFIGIRNTANK